MMAGWAAVFRHSFFRALRETAVFIVLGASLLLLVFGPLSTAFGFYESEGLVRDVGLSALFLGGIFSALVCAGLMDSAAMTSLVLLRPVGRAGLCLGNLGGLALCVMLLDATLFFAAFTVLRTGAGQVDVFLVMAVSAAGVCWGGWRHFRRAGSFASHSVVPLFVLNGLVFARLWLPYGGAVMASDDILLFQVGLLCFCLMLCVFFAWWAGHVMFGRTGGVIFGWAVLLVGLLRENLQGLPRFLVLPLNLLVPDISLVWGGDFFYADVDVLPWDFVAAGAGYLGIWSIAMVCVALGVFYGRRFEGLRVSDLRG